MIYMQPSAILVLFVCIPLVVIAVLSFFYAIRNLHRPTRTRESIYICVKCGHVYAIARNRPMDRCPRCGTLNDAVRT